MNPYAAMCALAYICLYTHTQETPPFKTNQKPPSEEQRLKLSFELGNFPHNMFAVYMDLMKHACVQAKKCCRCGCLSWRCGVLPGNSVGVKQWGEKAIGQDSALAGIKKV